MSGDEPGLTRDALLDGAVALLQRRTGHRAGTDAVLLAQLAPLRPGDRVVDLGSATGAVGLMVARRDPTCRVRLIEKDPALVALARRNVALNGVADRVDAVEGDVFARSGPGGLADLVVTNPPFFEAGTGRPSPDADRATAHVFEGGGLPAWLAEASRLLVPRGRLCFIHRADALDRCLAAIAPAFGSVTVRPVHPVAARPASRIVVVAVKGGRGPFVLGPPLVLHERDGTMTDEAADLHRRPRTRQDGCAGA